MKKLVSFAFVLILVLQTVSAVDITDNYIQTMASEEAIESMQIFKDMPEAYINQNEKQKVEENPNGHLSLLKFLEYDPYERDQGSCGNCWVWAATAAVEMALNFNQGIRERLSIQYINSNFKTAKSWSCKGGNNNKFSNFYNLVKKFIPWSNKNADFKDAKPLYKGHSNLDPRYISEKIYYPIENINWQSIPTYNVGKETAIENIKAVLQQGKAVYFAFYMPKKDHWRAFSSSWLYYLESSVWNPDYSCYQEWEDGSGHAVVIVGYDETDPNNPYWIVLNSWGNNEDYLKYQGVQLRPHGTFNLDMDMDYDCADYFNGDAEQSFEFNIFDINFGNKDGIRISPVEQDSVRVGHVNIVDEYIEAGAPLLTQTYLESNEEYMNLKNIKVTWVIPELGIRRSAGPFNLEMGEDIMKHVTLDIPEDTPAGDYDVRITITNSRGELRRVKHRVITVV